MRKTMVNPNEAVVAVAIIGGGICGVMAGARCVRDGLSFVILERGSCYGGNWFVRANSYSHLQVYELALSRLCWSLRLPGRGCNPL